MISTRPNRWHAAILTELARTTEPRTPAQIWAGIEAAGFQHGSLNPRATLGARLAELAAARAIRRVGAARYQSVKE